VNRMSHGPKKLFVQQLMFLGEQDGSPERLLKSQLSELFKTHTDIRAAFLATASIGQPAGATVVLVSRASRSHQLKPVAEN
jgi:hypothetical protein